MSKNNALLGVNENSFITGHGYAGLGYELDLIEYGTLPKKNIEEIRKVMC